MSNSIAQCMIVDDEILAAKNIMNYLKNFEWVNLVKHCDNAVSAFDSLSKEKIDLMFLDIHMPEMTGLELLKTISTKPYTIITTASSEHALESYELEVNDYLVKPISLQRFMRSMQRFSEHFQLLSSAQNISTYNTPPQVQNYLQVKENYKTVKIQIDQICYIESFREYSHIHTNEKTIITKQNLSTLETELKSRGFLRIHKSYIINIKMAYSYTANFVQILEKEIPIGKSFKDAALQILKK